MASSDRGFDSLLDCRQSGDRAIPYALMHCLLCTRHVVNNDHAVLPPEGDSLTADSTLVMSAAVTEPAPVASIQVEQVLDARSCCDLIRHRDISREALIGVLKKHLDGT